MLLHFSEERRIVHPGHVAEWCPRCSAPAPFKVERTEFRTKWLGIPVSSWKKRGETAPCGVCNLRLHLDTSRYPQLSGIAGQTTDLVRLTNPGLVAAAALRQQQIDRARAGRLTPTEREEAAAEALRRTCMALPPSTRSQRTAAAIGWIGLTLALGIPGLIWVARYCDMHPSRVVYQWRSYAIVTAWGLNSAAVGVVIFTLVRLVRPWRRRKLFAMVGDAVAPLALSPAEVSSAAQAERARGNPICLGVSAEVATRRIMQATSSDPFAASAMSRAA